MGVTTSTVRASALQALSFATVGAVYPFLALELTSAETSGVVLLLALVSAPLLRLFGGPIWGWLADRMGGVRGPLWTSGIIAVVGVAILLGVQGPAVIAGTLILAAGRAGAVPLVEAASVAAVDRDPGRYGAVRRWGSAGFMLAVIIAATSRDWTGLSPLWIGLVLAAGFVAVSLTMPRIRVQAARPRLTEWLQLARDPLVLATLLTSALHFAGVALYDGFFAIHLKALGMSTSWLGLSIGLGIGTEIVVLSAGAWFLGRLGARWLLVAAVLIHIPRWILTALGQDALWLIPVQAVHGFGFGAYWLASIAILTERAPRHLDASVQGLLAASAGGVGALIGNLVGTLVVERAPTQALFWTATGLSVGATLIALAIASLTRPGGRVAPSNAGGLDGPDGA